MKLAVINFSGNVGETTVARHLLLPRVPGAELIVVESVNADGGKSVSPKGNKKQSLRGSQFVQLQEYMQTIESAVVDIGASNIEELLSLMQIYPRTIFCASALLSNPITKSSAYRTMLTRPCA